MDICRSSWPRSLRGMGMHEPHGRLILWIKPTNQRALLQFWHNGGCIEPRVLIQCLSRCCSAAYPRSVASCQRRKEYLSMFMALGCQTVSSLDIDPIIRGKETVRSSSIGYKDMVSIVFAEVSHRCVALLRWRKRGMLEEKCLNHIRIKDSRNFIYLLILCKQPHLPLLYVSGAKTS